MIAPLEQFVELHADSPNSDIQLSKNEENNLNQRRRQKVPITVAIIGVIGTIVAALITAGLPFFQPKPSISPSPVSTDNNGHSPVGIAPSLSVSPTPSLPIGLNSPSDNRTVPANALAPYQGKYTFSWREEANKTSACDILGALDELIIYDTGLMKGHFTGKNNDINFNGSINLNNGEWSGIIPFNSYRFKGKIHDNQLSGRYIGPSKVLGDKECQGTVEGVLTQPN